MSVRGAAPAIVITGSPATFHGRIISAAAPARTAQVKPASAAPVARIAPAAPTAAPKGPDFGPLAGLAGNWKGAGFAQVSLPAHDALFQVFLATTNHSLSFVPLGSPVLNRGSNIPDMNMGALTYNEAVSDAASGRGLHVESGVWLNEPNGQISRMGVVPHGNAFNATIVGAPRTLQGAPVIPDADTHPFTLGADGTRQNDNNDFYLAPFKAAGLPAGIPASAVFNPNQVLQDANKELLSKGNKFISTIELKVAFNPVGGIDGTPITPTGQGGITNTDSVKNNVPPTSLIATYWLEKVQAPDGSTFDQLQISQTVVMDFIGIKWPHTTVATLRRAAN